MTKSDSSLIQKYVGLYRQIRLLKEEVETYNQEVAFSHCLKKSCTKINNLTAKNVNSKLKTLNLIKFFIRLNPQMSPWGAFPWFNETPGFNQIRLRQNQLRLIFQTIKTQV